MIENTLKYESAVFFVKNMEISKKFYTEILDQKITMDFGKNVIFQGGLSIWEEEYALNTIYSSNAANIKVGKNSSEIYFETTDIDDFYKKIKKEGIEIIHDILEHPWGQRGFRFFDPDEHIIEISEPMSTVALRYYDKGINIKAISEKTQIPINMIKKIIETHE